MATEDRPQKRKKVIPDTPGANVTDPLSPDEIAERAEEAAKDAGESVKDISTASDVDSSTDSGQQTPSDASDQTLPVETDQSSESPSSEASGEESTEAEETEGKSDAESAETTPDLSDSDESPSPESGTTSAPDVADDAYIEAELIEDLQRERDALIRNAIDICKRHADVAKTNRRHRIAHAFNAVRQIVEQLDKALKGVEYWKVQS